MNLSSLKIYKTIYSSKRNKEGFDNFKLSLKYTYGIKLVNVK